MTALFAATVAFALIYHVCSFQLTISRNFGDKIILISEIQLFNQGIAVPRERLSVEYVGSVDGDLNIDNCFDGSVLSMCQISPPDTTSPSSIVVDSSGIFFDQIVIHTQGNYGYGVTLSVGQGDDNYFWKHRVTDKKNIHVFDIHDTAMDHHPIKIVSTFNYNGDIAALFHIQYLFDVVNEFIIVESRYTHNGDRKSEMYFQKPENQEAFAPFMSKIKYLVIQEEFPQRPPDFIDPIRHAWMQPAAYDAFWRDHFQRAFVSDFVDKDSKTLFMCVDADEIVDKNIVAQLKDEWMYDNVYVKNKIRFEMRMFNYNFRWIQEHGWAHPFAASTEIYLAETDRVQARAVRTENEINAQNAGWHLSYFMSIEDIVRKIESFAHREFNKAEFKSREHVEMCIREGKDMYLRENARLYDAMSDTLEFFLPEGWEEFQQTLLEIQGQ